MYLDSNASMLIALIQNAGYEAYAVGGCVRDSLMNKPCSDIDIATSAKPEITEQILQSRNIKYIETGLKHGTITAVVNGETYEITTYRTEGAYKDNRHPENVSFVDELSLDLSRRDFTMNALAYSRETGIVDLFSGRSDIENKRIRAVGDPDQRFREDALRMMRAVRFAAVLGFDIEENTKSAIFRNKELLNNVSAERLFTELSKLLLGDNAYSVLVEYRAVIAVFIPELIPMFDCRQNNPWHLYDVWVHTCKAVASAEKNVKLRLTMLFHDLGKPQMKTTDDSGIDHFKGHQAVSASLAGDILKRLKVSNEVYDFVMTLVPVHDMKINADKKSIKRQLSRLGRDSDGEYYLRHLLSVKRADKLAQNTQMTAQELEHLVVINDIMDEVIASSEALNVSDLAVNGFDLMRLGLKGRDIGNMLEALLDKVIGEKLENNKESLIEYAEKSILNKNQ